MRRGAIAAVLLSSIVAPVALAENCPPNAFHCDLVVVLGDTAYVVAEFRASVTTSPSTTTAIFAFEPGVSVHLWANVYVASNSTGLAANVSIDFNETAGVAFPNGTEQTVLATQNAQNLTFPIQLDEGFAAGDVAFIPVVVEHEDGSTASTHIPLQVGALAARSGPEPSAWDWWWLFALFLLVGIAIGFALARLA